MNERSSPEMAVHLLCGFLGSGKTTRINALIASGELTDALFLINDFGSLNIDAKLIESRDGEVLRLSNGCACCGVSGNLSAQLSSIRHWDNPPRRLVFEASGVAKPRPLKQLFMAACGYTLEQVDLLVDLSSLDQLLEDQAVGDIVREQIAEVSDVLINRWTGLPGPDRQSATQQLRSINPSARLHWSEAIAQNDKANLVVFKSEGEIPDFRSLVPGALASHTVPLPVPIDTQRLEMLFAAARPILLRAKGFVRSRQKPEEVAVLQWTQNSFQVTPSVARQDAVLVLIGKGKEHLERLATFIR